MKKLMFAMAVAACAAAVQASTLTYGFGAGVIDPDKINYGNVYALWAEQGATIDFSSLAGKTSYTIADFTGIDGLHMTRAGVAQTADVTFKASATKLTAEREYVYPAGVGASGTASNKTVDFYIVMIQEDGVVAAYSNPITEIIKGAFQFDEASAIASSVTVVPEPTSGLLLLLGVAGLALKRKRA